MARQFTEEEAQRIFARAAERQHRAPRSAGGLTLEELKEIGASAGLDPEHVAAAVAEAQIEPAPAPTWQGVPLRASASRLVPGEVSDETWMRIVDQARAQHQTPGVIEQTGARRVWRQHEQSLHGASVTVVAGPTGTHVTVESARAPEDIATYVLGAITGMMGGIGLLAYLVNDKPKGLILMAVMAAIALAVAVGASVSVRRRARATPARLASLLDRVEAEILRDAGPAPAFEPASPAADVLTSLPEAEAPRLDLGAPDGPEQTASGTPGRRTRA